MFSDIPTWLHDWYFSDPAISKFTEYDHRLYYLMCTPGKPCLLHRGSCNP